MPLRANDRWKVHGLVSLALALGGAATTALTLQGGGEWSAVFAMFIAAAIGAELVASTILMALGLARQRLGVLLAHGGPLALVGLIWAGLEVKRVHAAEHYRRVEAEAEARAASRRIELGACVRVGPLDTSYEPDGSVSLDLALEPGCEALHVEAIALHGLGPHEAEFNATEPAATMLAPMMKRHLRFVDPRQRPGLIESWDLELGLRRPAERADGDAVLHFQVRPGADGLQR